MGDTSWFPKPRPKPLAKPVSMTWFLLGTILPVVGIAGLVIALSSSHGHSKAGSSTAVTSTASGLAAREQSARAAFASCMQSMGYGGHAHFGTSRSAFEKFREAQEACTSLGNTLGGGGSAPTPTPAVTGSAPAA
jgi:hypothetical protein